MGDGSIRLGPGETTDIASLVTLTYNSLVRGFRLVMFTIAAAFLLAPDPVLGQKAPTDNEQRAKERKRKKRPKKEPKKKAKNPKKKAKDPKAKKPKNKAKGPKKRAKSPKKGKKKKALDPVYVSPSGAYLVVPADVQMGETATGTIWVPDISRSARRFPLATEQGTVNLMIDVPDYVEVPARKHTGTFTITPVASGSGGVFAAYKGEVLQDVIHVVPEDGQSSGFSPVNESLNSYGLGTISVGRSQYASISYVDVIGAEPISWEGTNQVWDLSVPSDAQWKTYKVMGRWVDGTLWEGIGRAFEQDDVLSGLSGGKREVHGVASMGLSFAMGARDAWHAGTDRWFHFWAGEPTRETMAGGVGYPMAIVVDPPILDLPPLYVFPTGPIDKAFTIEAPHVTEPTTVTVKGRYIHHLLGEQYETPTLTLTVLPYDENATEWTPPPDLAIARSGAALEAADVEIGDTAVATITLPTVSNADRTIHLTTRMQMAEPYIRLPESVTVRAGARSATFDITPIKDGVAGVFASYEGDILQDVIRVLPAGGPSGWGPKTGRLMSGGLSTITVKPQSGSRTVYVSLSNVTVIGASGIAWDGGGSAWKLTIPNGEPWKTYKMVGTRVSQAMRSGIGIAYSLDEPLSGDPHWWREVLRIDATHVSVGGGDPNRWRSGDTRQIRVYAGDTANETEVSGTGLPVAILVDPPILDIPPIYVFPLGAASHHFAPVAPEVTEPTTVTISTRYIDAKLGELYPGGSRTVTILPAE
jgi:hypothetical protein